MTEWQIVLADDKHCSIVDYRMSAHVICLCGKVIISMPWICVGYECVTLTKMRILDVSLKYKIIKDSINCQSCVLVLPLQRDILNFRCHTSREMIAKKKRRRCNINLAVREGSYAFFEKSSSFYNIQYFKVYNLEPFRINFSWCSFRSVITSLSTCILFAGKFLFSMPSALQLNWGHQVKL